MIGVYKGIYDEPTLEKSEFITPSIYTFKQYFYSKNHKIEWSFYAHEDIDYTKIDFPENLIDVHRKRICFSKGELEIQTDLTTKDYDNDFEVRKTVYPSYYTLIDFSCYYQDRQDLMNFIPVKLLDSSDFRFSIEKRNVIYNQINEDPKQSYYELAKKHSFDLGRFYK